MQKDMVDTLTREGFQINERELVRVRLKLGLTLRKRRRKAEMNGLENDEDDEDEEEDEEEAEIEAEIDAEKGDGHNNHTSRNEDTDSEDEVRESRRLLRQFPKQAPAPKKAKPKASKAKTLEKATTAARTTSNPVPEDPEEALRKQVRLEQLRIESEEKWQSRKRRRRTRTWHGLPPDAPGEPPRFPSETTLDESKAYLSLGNTQYRQLRDQFQTMCNEEGVIKKTIAGPEKWSHLKQRLVRENAHLYNLFRQDPEAVEQLSASSLTTPTNQKALSLDVICSDVTKRIRTLGTTLRIPDAKNILGLNPHSARKDRDLLTEMLKERHYTTKMEAGEEGWAELKHEWVRRSDTLSLVFAAGDATPNLDAKSKALETLARDVLKRLRNENYKRKSSSETPVAPGLGPGPAPPHASTARRQDAPTNGRSAANDRNNNRIAATSAAAVATASSDFSSGPLPPGSEFEIDPSLLLAASDPSMLPQSAQTALHMHGSFGQHQSLYINHHITPAPPVPQQPSSFPLPLPLPIYFRLHPQSRTNFPTKTLWLNVLQDGTLDELRNMAVREHPGTVVLSVEGVVVHKIAGPGGQTGESEICIKIDVQEELLAYSRHVGAAGKATFVVLLGLA